LIKVDWKCKLVSLTWHKYWRNSCIIDKRFDGDNEEEFVVCSQKSDEEVNNEKDGQRKVDLKICFYNYISDIFCRITVYTNINDFLDKITFFQRAHIWLTCTKKYSTVEQKLLFKTRKNCCEKWLFFKLNHSLNVDAGNRELQFIKLVQSISWIWAS
jgi:hypothetical protein